MLPRVFIFSLIFTKKIKEKTLSVSASWRSDWHILGGCLEVSTNKAFNIIITAVRKSSLLCLASLFL